MERTAVPSFFVLLLNSLIKNVFIDYSCLNVHIHRTYEPRRNEIVNELHKTAVALIVTDDFHRIDERCGFLLLSTSTESMEYLANRTFNQIIRILIVNEDGERILNWLQKSSILLDMDVLLAEITENAVSNFSTTNVYRKSRHDLKMRSIDYDNSTVLFFESVHRQFTKFIDYNKRIVKVITFHCPVFGSIRRNELVDGVETRILLEITKKLNLIPEIVVPNDGKRWGTAYPNKTISGGILKSLHTKETDVGFCSLWIEGTKFPYIVLSAYWEILCIKFLVPKPKIIAARWNNIFKPLPTNLWTLVLVTAVFASAASSALRYLYARLFAFGKTGIGLISEFITIVGLLVMAKNADKRDDRRASRHLFLWWSLFAMIITSIYSSSLVSHLTYPEFERMIDTFEAFAKAGLYWGTPYEPPINHIFDLNNRWHREFAERFRFEEKRTDRAERIGRGNYSVLVKCVGDAHFMEVQDVPVEMLRELRSPKSCFGYFMLGLGYRKTLPYAEQSDRILRRLVESGVTKYWLNRLFEKEYPLTTFAKVYEYKIPPERVHLRALNLLNLRPAFAILALGTVSATFIFALEIYTRRKAKRIS